MVCSTGPTLAIRDALDAALLDLGRLDSVTTLLADTQLFLYMYVRKGVVLSSQIEEAQSSLSDQLLVSLYVHSNGGESCNISQFTSCG